MTDNRIKALVMTYDRHRVFAEHMMAVYNDLWPDHPFQFRIPYQHLGGEESKNRHYLQSPPSVMDTVITLLDGIDDEEWVYWCWDDNYPGWLDVQRMSAMADWVRSVKDQDISGILACRCIKFAGGKLFGHKKIHDDRGNVYREIKSYQRFWSHQFLRAKVIRHLFFDVFPDDLASIRTMGGLTRRAELPASHRRFVSEQNLMLLGESMVKGVITKNCHENMKRYGISMPAWWNGVIGPEKIMGPRDTLRRWKAGISADTFRRILESYR